MRLSRFENKMEIEFGLPVFEVRHSLIYATIHNEKYEYGLPVFNISN